MSEYKELIKETPEELHTLERLEKSGKLRDRLKFLRLLKEGLAEGVLHAARLTGFSKSTAYRFLNIYEVGGLDALIVLHYKGRIPTIGVEGEAKFLEASNQRSFASLKEVQAWLHQEFGVLYTIGGTWDMCKRLKVKLKTQRPSNPKQAPGAIEDYQKKVP